MTRWIRYPNGWHVRADPPVGEQPPPWLLTALIAGAAARRAFAVATWAPRLVVNIICGNHPR